MTTRINNLKFGWMMAYAFVLTLVFSHGLKAQELEAALKVALRPGAGYSTPVSPVNPQPTPGAPGFYGDEYRPDFMDGPPAAKPTEAQERQLEITSRYQDSRMLALVRGTSLNQMMSLYSEASRLIDTRHVSPLSYEERTRAALGNLIAALENPAFLQAAGGTANSQSVRQLQNELAALQNSPARSSSEALGLMQYAAELANRRLGLRREAVAVEFLNGTLDSLDQYTAFVPSRTGFGPGAALEEQIVGIGVELKLHDNGALINDVLENSPAAQGRLMKGDIITGVGGQSTRGMSLSQIGDLIGGRSGTAVAIRFDRGGREYTVNLTRRSVYVSSVSGAQMLTADTGYVRLKQFSESSMEDLDKALSRLYSSGMRNLVLDLRGNPGGLLTEAIEVSDMFLPSGRIVATRGRTTADNSEERATLPKTWRLPLAVLVDANSASASEIFAAAIQENGRGVIVGRKTYGKGTVQTHFPLQTVSGDLKLTTAKFYSPNGRDMAGAGVTPDVNVPANNATFSGALSQDPDVAAGLQSIRNGTAARLAASAGQRTP
jgi:carboxyl-terminal processing protease